MERHRHMGTRQSDAAPSGGLHSCLAMVGILVLVSLLHHPAVAQSSTGPAGPLSSSSSSSSTGVCYTNRTHYDSRNCSASTQSCIRIGIFYCNNKTEPANVTYAQTGHCSAIAGYNAMVCYYRDRIKAKGGMLAGVPVYFVSALLSPRVPHSRSEIAALVDNHFFAPGTDGRPLVDFVILPPGIAWDTAMLRLEAQGIPSIASSSPLSSLFQCGTKEALLWQQPPCTTPSTRRFKYAHGLSNAAEDYMSGWETLVKLKKISTIAIMIDALPVSLLSTQLDQPSQAHLMMQPLLTGVLQGARENSFKVVYDQLVNITSRAITTPFDSDTVPLDFNRMDTAIAKVRDLHPDAIMLVSTRCKDWLAGFERVNYLPDSIAGYFCYRRTIDSDPPTRFVVSPSQWSARMTGTEYTESIDNSWSLFPNRGGGNSTVGSSSPRQFQQLWQQLTAQTESQDVNAAEPRGAEAAVLAAFQMLEGAIALTGTLDPDKVNKQLQLYFQPSFFGLLTTNRFGMNRQKQIVSLQRDLAGDWAVVAPQSSAGMDFIFPAPTWEEREYLQQLVGRYKVDWIILALMILCLLMTLLSMVAIVRYRVSHPHALGRELYVLVGLGCLFAYTSVLTWTVDSTDAQCASRIWLWTLAFHLTLGPLIAATGRMAWLDWQRRRMRGAGQGDASGNGQRFSASRNKRIILTITVGLFLPQLFLNLLWTYAFGGLSLQLHQTEDRLRINANYTTCGSEQEGGEVINILTLAYTAVLLFVSLFSAWNIRKSNVANLFQDARPIALAMAFFTLTSAIVLAVYLSLVGQSHTAASQSVLLALLNIGMLIAYQTAFGVLVWRRLLTIWSSPSRAKAAPVDAAVVPVKTGAVGVDGAPQDSVAMTPMQQAQMKIGLPSHALKNPASVLPPLHPQHGVLQHTEPGVPNGTTDVLSIHPGADDGAGDGGGGAPFGVFSRLVSEPPREAPYHLVPAHKQTPSPTTPMSPAGGSDTALQHTQPNNPMQGSAAQLNVRSLQSPGVGDSASGFASQDPDVPFPAILPSRSVLDALSPTELSVWRAQVEHHAAEVDQLVSMQLEVQRADARLKYKTT